MPLLPEVEEDRLLAEVVGSKLLAVAVEVDSQLAAVEVEGRPFLAEAGAVASECHHLDGERIPSFLRFFFQPDAF